MSSFTLPARAHRGRERAAAALVIALLAAACIGFWVGVPLGFLWALALTTDSGATHLVVGLIGVPAAMALFTPVLFWLNGLYLRVSGTAARLDEDQREAGWHRRIGGPLEPMLLASFAIAFAGLVIWFFAFAENPPPGVW